MSIFRKITLVAAMAVSISSMAQQMPTLPLDPDVRYGKLENGLTYYIRHNEEPRERANFYIAQKVGSVQEDENQRGLAHFLEHMCFNGTKHFPGNRVVGYCESIGVKFGQNLNAYTSTDETVYNIDDVPTLSENIDSCLLILRDWSDGLLLEPAEIDKERGVIHEEWRMRTSGQMRVLNRNLEAIYPGSKYGKRMPIGLMSVVDNFKPQELRDYYEKWYRPDLQAIVVVGDIDVDDIEKRIINTFSDIKMPENAAQYESYPVPDNEEPIILVDKDPELANAMILIDYKTEALSPEQNGTMAYLMSEYISDVIATAMTARFYELSQNPDCPYVVAQIGFGKFLLAKTVDALELVVIPKPGKDTEAVEAALKEMERASRFGITGTEIYRARQEVLSQIDKLYDNRNKQKSTYFVNKYVRHFLDGKATPGIETETQIYKMLDSQLPEQAYSTIINSIASNVEKNFVFLAMYPEKEGYVVPKVEDMKQAITSAHLAELEAYVDNVKDEPLIAQMPKKGSIKSEKAAENGYTLWTLSNGIKVYFKQTDFNDTEVLMRAISYGGFARLDNSQATDIKLFSDFANNTGIGNFTEIEKGKLLAGKQVNTSLSLSQKTETVSGKSTPKDLRTLFELTYLRFQGPTNDVEGFNSIVSQYNTLLENAEKQPTAAFSDSIRAVFYQHNPIMARISKKELANASFEGYQKLYKERFASAGDFDFFFTGAFNKDSLKLYCEQYIASLPTNGKREEFKDSSIKPVKGVVMNRFNREMETPQAYMCQIWNGDCNYTVKNDIVVTFLASILDMRYTRTIREEAGYAYSVGVGGSLSYQSGNKYSLEITAPFTPSKVDSVLILVRESIDDIAKNGVTDEELENVRKFELKDFADSQRQNNFWQEVATSSSFYKIDAITGYEEILKGITSKDIQNFAKNILLKQNNCATIIMLPESLEEK